MSQDDGASLQEKYAAQSFCFGCGPSNADGLRIRSFPEDGKVVCEWSPQPKFQSFAGALNGGIVGSLFDCHCNWTAAHHLMQAGKLDKPPCTVTAEISVKFMRPTPSDRPLKMVAHVVQAKERSANVHGEMYSDGELCATCNAVFVAVKEGHPAYHRW